MPPTPYVEDVVPLMKQAAENVIREMTDSLASKGWAAREKLHQEIVNKTVRAMENYTRYAEVGH